MRDTVFRFAEDTAEDTGYRAAAAAAEHSCRA